jgi:hypothetical protein
MNNIHYDIIDKIVEYLDIESTRNFLLSSSDIYNIYRHNKYFQVVMIRKICEYFCSLNKFKIYLRENIRKESDNNVYELYTCLNKIYNYFNKHQDASLSDILIYLCDNNLSNKGIFEMIISKCYFTKSGKYIYNAIRADDLLYLLSYSEDMTIITKYINVDPLIVLHTIRYKISVKNKKDTLYLLNYLLFKYFYKYSNYIEDILTDIVCDIIKFSDIYLLQEVYKKMSIYKFKLNYQKVINICITNNKIECLELINIKMLEQNYLLTEGRGDKIIISREYIRLLMKNNSYKMLEKIIQLYLREMINLNIYMHEICTSFNYKSDECMNLLKYMNEMNKKRIIDKIK